MIRIRGMQEDDCFALEEIGDKPMLLFKQYFNENIEGHRTVLIAEYDGKIAGYAMVEWLSGHPFLAQKRIAEISDLTVLECFRRNGVATLLMDDVEKRISAVSNQAGVCVGMSKDFGPAQIFYVKRGYLPDGNGLTWKGNSINPGAQIKADNTLVLVMIKTL